MKCLLLVITLVVGIVVGAPADETINEDRKGFQDGHIEGIKKEVVTQISTDDMKTHLHGRRNRKRCIYGGVDANGLPLFRSFTLTPSYFYFSMRNEDFSNLGTDLIKEINYVDDINRNETIQYLSVLYMVNHLNKSSHQIKSVSSNENNIYEDKLEDSEEDELKYLERNVLIDETLEILVRHEATVFDAFNSSYYNYIIDTPFTSKIGLFYKTQFANYETHVVPYCNLVKYSKAILHFCQVVKSDILKAQFLLAFSKIENRKTAIEESYNCTLPVLKLVNRIHSVLYENIENFDYPAKNDKKKEKNIYKLNNIVSLNHYITTVHHSMKHCLNLESDSFWRHYATNIAYANVESLSHVGKLPPPKSDNGPVILGCD